MDTSHIHLPIPVEVAGEDGIPVGVRISFRQAERARPADHGPPGGALMPDELRSRQAACPILTILCHGGEKGSARSAARRIVPLHDVALLQGVVDIDVYAAQPVRRRDRAIGGIERRRIGSALEREPDRNGRGKARFLVPRVEDGVEVYLPLVLRVHDNHVVPVDVHHPVEAPLEDMAASVEVLTGGGGGAIVVLRPVPGGYLPAAGGRVVAVLREGTLHGRPVVTGTPVAAGGQFRHGAAYGRHEVVGAVVHTPLRGPLDGPHVEVPPHAHPSVTEVAVVGEGEPGRHVHPARGDLDGDRDGRRPGELGYLDGGG